MHKVGITGPLFKWFGSKWLSSKTLPYPAYDLIIEPFAGGAGYSLRHYQKDVIIAENNPLVYALWKWLITEARPSDIQEIPIDLKKGVDIREVEMSEGQALLLKHWQRTNNVGNCWTVSPWGDKPGQWTANTRARLTCEIQYVKHWQILDSAEKAFSLARNGTWFIDPPYEFNYQYKSKAIDYPALANMCKTAARNGQAIVCEAICPKTGMMPNWLPFIPWAKRITSRRKAENNHHSKELIWQADNGEIMHHA